MLKDSRVFSSFSVDDLDKAKAFYQEILELEVVDNPMGLIEIHFPNNNNIMVYPKPNHIPATFTILNFNITNIESIVEGLTARGVVFEKYDEEYIKTDEKGISHGNGPTVAWFKDPAGNIFAVMEE
ncbi:VOC family protein [Pedobacter frigidisoli]|uniref:VOC family protein n=1 Tax=Pedobacter frigidisoli TaxID=2530455 RepID=A0A4R0P3K7_9SPHI|nr:VOC family protein [Pedobacter frigidisoli]TCD08344.1 VOC family protein [Pedobacter frigidisoli]